MKSIATTLLIFALAGCAASGTQVSEQAALQFKEGETTEKQIVAKLGRPNSVTIVEGKRLISYIGSQVQIKGASFIPIVGLFAGGADVQMTMATFHIDSNGVLEKVSYTSGDAGTRNGTTPAETTAQEPTAVK